jgi:pyrroloquinoline quinone (PQQ) biosynthesis protein C
MAFRERLLSVMDRKHHPAWVHLTRPGLGRASLLEHFRHEYRTYVRDFPVLLARVLGQGPPAGVRRALAENLYEEQTGGLSLGVPHPDLFLEMMEGLGFTRDELEGGSALVPEAIAYREHLDAVSASPPWVVGAAVLTIFVEGSVHERAELAGEREVLPLDEAIAQHPLVAAYGCPPEKMRLVRAHRAVEGGHRADAWRMVLEHARDAATQDLVVRAMEDTLAGWLAYRGAVARAMAIIPRPA